MILEYDNHREAVAFILCLGMGNVGRTKLAVVSASEAFSQSVLDEGTAGWEDADEGDEEYVDHGGFGPDPVGVKEFGPDVLIFLAPGEMDSHYRELMIANMKWGT